MSWAWSDAYAAAQKEVGPLPLTREAFERGARERLVRRLARQGRGAGELALATALQKSAPADLYLAVALTEGSAEARAALAARTTERLLPVARALGRSEGEAPETVRAALDEPPTAYDGTAPLVTWFATQLARGPARVACPPDNLFAGLAAESLESREVPGAAGHVRACPGCSAALNVLERAGLARPGVLVAGAAWDAPPVAATPPPLPRPRVTTPPPRRRRWVLGLALLAVVAGLAAFGVGGRLLDFEARRQDTERSVERTARGLAQSDPPFFGDFEPYDRALLERVEPEAALAGFSAVFPRGKVLEKTPTFVWTKGTTAGPFVVTVKDRSGDVLWTRTSAGETLAWPTEEPALLRELSYTWTVASAEAPTAPAEEDDAPFRIEGEQELIRWERRTERLAKAVTDEGTREMLTAQMALRRGYVWEAFTRARAHMERAPKDAYGRAFLGYLQRQHGLKP